MSSGAGDTTQLVPGYPIRTPWDHSSVDSSPRPIAASHVLHRPLVPRHPPSALTNLPNTQKLHIPTDEPQNTKRYSRPLCKSQPTTNPPPATTPPGTATSHAWPRQQPPNPAGPRPTRPHGCSLRTSTGCPPPDPVTTTAPFLQNPTRVPCTRCAGHDQTRLASVSAMSNPDPTSGSRGPLYRPLCKGPGRCSLERR